MNKLLIVTSDSLRHKYFALRILKEIKNSKVVFETRNRINYYRVKYDGLTKNHFDKLFKTEEDYFKKIVSENKEFIDKNTLMKIEKDEINSDNFFSFLNNFNPSCIALYSVSIIRERLITAFKNRLFNVHAGLSPYYRGTATNIWPIINGEIEYIGMTVHHIDKGIDSGGLILQGRPNLESDDDTHTMACKNTILAAELIIKVVNYFFINKNVPSHFQDLSKGKQYYFNDFSDETILKLNELLKQRVIKNYIDNPKKIDYIKW